MVIAPAATTTTRAGPTPTSIADRQPPLPGLLFSRMVFSTLMRLLVDQAGEELLGIAEDEGPGEDLGGGVEGAEAGDELASHEEEAEEGGDGAHGGA